MKLSINNLTKQYPKGKLGQNCFSFTVENVILGLLEPSGAGKSALMKILATIFWSTGGTITLDVVDSVANPNKLLNVQ